MDELVYTGTMSRSYRKRKRHLGKGHVMFDPGCTNPYSGKVTGGGLKCFEFRNIRGYRQMLRVKSAASTDPELESARGRAREVPIQVWYDLWTEGRIKTAWR